MKEKVTFLDLDVHAETVTVAVAEPDGEEQVRACYEAGPTGYVLNWQLTELGVECLVIAPTKIGCSGSRGGKARHPLSRIKVSSASPVGRKRITVFIAVARISLLCLRTRRKFAQHHQSKRKQNPLFLQLLEPIRCEPE